MAYNLDRVDARSKLPPRRAPYTQRLAEGRQIGFRKLTTGSVGNWLALYWNGEKYEQTRLGDFADLEERHRFGAAKAAAEEWFRHLDQGGVVASVTVKAACESYAAKLRQEKGEPAAKDAEGTFKRLVVGDPEREMPADPIARVELAKAKPAHFTAWRERILERGSKSYFNRNLTPLRAALNLALDDRKVSSDFAWSKALRPLKLDKSQGRRTIYLDREQRQRLIENASAEFKPLVTAWALLPVRPGDIPRCRVEHLDVRHRILHVPTGKTGSREVPLPDEALAHFKECAKGKTPGAWLVAKADAGQWDRFYWRDTMWEAVQKAGLPEATVGYTIRHSVITDLVVGGLDIFTVAKLSGTSVTMIDRHYGHLRADHAREALAKLSLK